MSSGPVAPDQRCRDRRARCFGRIGTADGRRGGESLSACRIPPGTDRRRIARLKLGTDSAHSKGDRLGGWQALRPTTRMAFTETYSPKAKFALLMCRLIKLCTTGVLNLDLWCMSRWRCLGGTGPARNKPVRVSLRITRGPAPGLKSRSRCESKRAYKSTSESSDFQLPSNPARALLSVSRSAWSSRRTLKASSPSRDAPRNWRMPYPTPAGGMARRPASGNRPSLRLALVLSLLEKEGFAGAPGGTRTPGLLVRSQSLYPAELRAR